jgi:hypothetical protein
LIFHGDYTERLTAWREFREGLEIEPLALQLTLQLYQQCPLTHTKTNFFDRSTWPQAWNLIEKNDYNTVDRLLGVWYTLRLTDRFVRDKIDLIQCVDKNSNQLEKTNTYHALAVDHQYLVLENSAILYQKEFDNLFISQYTYFNL